MRCQRQILDIRCWAHVSNAEVLQRSGLSTIGDILRHWRLSLFGHVARLDPRVPAHNALRLTVDISYRRRCDCLASSAPFTNIQTYLLTYLPTKAERQWPAGEDGRVALATSSSTWFRRMPTLYCSYLRCGDLRSPGAMEGRSGSLGLRDDDDDDEGWLVSKMEVNYFSRHLQAVRNRDCWVFENHWRRM